MPYVTAADRFFVEEVSRRVEQETDYRINWVEAYGGSVAKLGEVLEATETGLLDVGLVPFPFEPTKLFLHNLNYYIPFNTPDPIQAIRVTRRVFEAFPVLIEVFEKEYNQKFLALGAVGDYNLTTTFPWSRLEELRGRKIAAAGPNLPLLRGTGAVPVQSDLNEAYTAFQTGVYEGWIMYPSSYYGFKLHEVSPHYKLVHFGAVAVTAITVNLDTWRRLPDPVRRIMAEVGRQYEEVAGREAADRDEEALELAKAKGAQVTVLDERERARWASILSNVPSEMAKEADRRGMPGSAVIRTYLEFLKEDGYSTPVTYLIP